MPRSCIVCGSNAGLYSDFAKLDLKVRACTVCGIGFLEEFIKEPVRFYQNNNYYAAWWSDKRDEQSAVRLIKERTAEWILDQIKPFLKSEAHILEVGCAFGYFLSVASKRGYRVTGLEISEAGEEARKEGFQVFQKTLEQFEAPEGSVDAAVMIDVFEHFEDPETALKKLRHLLNKKTGIVTFVVPDFGSFSCKALGRHWLHYKKEHLFYYSKRGLSKLLRKHGFEPLILKTAKKATSLSYIAAHSGRYHNLPSFWISLLRGTPFSTSPFMVRSELLCIAKAQPVS